LFNLKINLYSVLKRVSVILNILISFILLLCLNSPTLAVEENQAAIATAHPLATQAGFAVLKQGGNAFDAAVAISAALAVVEPSGSGLGGGGFWLLHRASDGFETMVDGREKAPLAAYRDMYLDAQGEIINGLSKNSGLAAGIPGLPAALVHLSEKYGGLSLAQSLRPAIQYAEQGFLIGERHRKLLNFRLDVLNKNNHTADIFLDNNKVPAAKTILKQTDLANTLKLMAQLGKQGFYAGKVAKLLVKGVNQAGGLWSQQDLDEYQVVERTPVKGEYKGIKITSAALPSSGGIVLVEALNILAKYPLDELDEISRKHLISEAMRRAYHDRALYMGDSDFVKVPVNQLLSKDYAAGLRASIRMDKATPSAYLSGNLQTKIAGKNTTHFSVIDQYGNRVAATLSVNFPFGAGFVANGMGVIMNNEMDDFVSKTGEMNGYGLVGGLANSIEPSKRMLSSMTPTFIEDANRIAVLGTPGGSRIISMVLLAVLDFAKGNGPESWVWQPRFHHQYIPDVIQYEKGGLTEDEIQQLTLLGHQLRQVGYRYGNMQAVQFNKLDKRYSAVSDPRGEGIALIR
jgi:gamma-glutamyltranspeptidase/glutathione hydrolase